VLSQTNYEHLKKCIESAPVPPMSRHLYDNMIKLIPNQLCMNYPNVLSELHIEITEEFENTMRKSRGKSVTLNNASDYRANGLLSDYIGWTKQAIGLSDYRANELTD